MMAFLAWVVFLAGAVPFWRAWRTLGHTSLRHALVWAALAWLARGVALLAPELTSPGEVRVVRYVALSLVGCAGVAVLGARRPGVVAWNFVVIGLLSVLLLFLAESVVAGGGELQLGPLRAAFLAVTLAIGILNYLPTRMAPAALLLATGCGLELSDLVRPAAAPTMAALAAELLILLAPVAALAVSWRPARTAHEADRLWRSFRDAFGLIWGLRLREQFDRAAANAGLAVELGWTGVRSTTGNVEVQGTLRDAGLNILRPLLKRFEMQEPDGESCRS
jgi:hypothetical protein